MALFFTLFVAGLLTILLPCILPLLPIVLGVSIAGRSRLRPLLMIAGMLASFIGSTFLLLVVLRQFVELADYVRIATYEVLLLFGLGFLTNRRPVLLGGAVLGSLFFIDKGWFSVIVAAFCGVMAMELGGKIASKIQQFGTDVQGAARTEFGGDNPLTAFVVGLTMGLVWVPCAGPALGFALTLVREEPGLRALVALGAYGLGTAVPLLLVGYGGQSAVHSVRSLSRFSGRIKQIAGVMLILTALAFRFNGFIAIQTWLVQNTPYGTLGTDIEELLFGEDVGEDMMNPSDGSSSDSMQLPKLPKITRAPEFTGLGPWHNSEPLRMADLRGKVVLIDFWTFSCINCVRTLPYIQGYWEKFKDTGKFVLIGMHTPEFVFEKSEKNVADAIKRHGLSYPVAQDNDFGTWQAFSNRYWPAKYLIDAEGYIRYTHFGEGGYEETDLAIQSLLQEIGVTVRGDMPDEPEGGVQRSQTPETYVGERSWPSLQNAQGKPTGEAVRYREPGELQLHRYALVGDWQLVEGERQVLRSAQGEIRMRFLGSEINLVLGTESGNPIPAEVFIDGASTKTFTVDHHDLYTLWKGGYGEHELTLKFTGNGVEAYAFTFGS